MPNTDGANATPMIDKYIFKRFRDDRCPDEKIKTQ